MMRRNTAAVFGTLLLDERSEHPLYKQLSRALREAMVDGRLRPGTKLPPTRNLAHDLGIARNTVVAAYDLLYSEGYLNNRVGAGSFVSSDIPEQNLKPLGYPRIPRVASEGAFLSKRGQWVHHFHPPSTTMENKIFTPGVPAIDAFPLKNWNRILSRTARNASQDILLANDPGGWWPLRSAIASYLGPARGVRCNPEQVIIVTSSRQAIYLTAILLANPGEQAWLEEPGYLDARASLLAAGLKLVPVPVDEQGIDVEGGIKAAPRARLAFVTPSNQYPYGVALALARRLRLIEWAKTTGGWIIEDDYDGEFRYAGKPLTALQGMDSHGRVIYIGTFSKIMFPALRLAYLVCPESLIDVFHAARRQLDGCVPPNGQAALAEFMDNGSFGSHIRQMRTLYASRQTVLIRLLEAEFSERFIIAGRAAGIHLLVKLPHAINDRKLILAINDPNVLPGALSRSFVGRSVKSGLVLGYGNSDIPELRHGVEVLARAMNGCGYTR